MSASATPSHTEIGVVYVAAVVQGLALVMFPAAGAIFTSAQGFGFDSTRYGAMFLPQVVLAVLASGLAFFPGNADRAVLALNALLGLGTALAPVLVAIAVIMGAWWLLPLVVACISAVIFAVVLMQPLRVSAEMGADSAGGKIGWRELPHRFWLYAAAVFLYGIVETINGNWAILYLSAERGVSARSASYALTAFWMMVTLGRVLIALISRRLPARWIYFGLTILLILVFQLASRVQGETEGILAFGMAGLACSAFLPLSISFGANEFPQLSAVMAGELIAFYQLGYGVAAFGIGPLRDVTGLPFSMLFAGASIVAAFLAVVALFVIRRPS